MDLLQQAAAGFAGIDVDARLKEQRWNICGRWLTRPEFAAYRPQIDWLIADGSNGPGCWIVSTRSCPSAPAAGAGPSASVPTA